MKFYDTLKGLTIVKLGEAVDVNTQERRVVYQVEGQSELFIIDPALWEEMVDIGSLVEIKN